MSAAPQQQGCSLPNLLLPFVLAAGGYVGWAVGSEYGVVVGLFGVVAGAILAIPTFALTLLVVISPLFLWDWWTRRSPPRA